MSDQNDLSLPDVNAASQTIDEIYARAFFGKLAELGHEPQTEEDARALLEIGMQLSTAEEPSTKQASFYETANASLKEVLAQAGVKTASYDARQAEEAAIAQTALAIAQVPEYYKAALAWQLETVPWPDAEGSQS